MSSTPPRLPTKNSVKNQAGPSGVGPKHSHQLLSNPRFSRLFGTVLGSPFLTADDPTDLPPELDLVDGALSAVPRSFTVTRPSSPAPSIAIDSFSIISPSEFDAADVFASNHYTYTYAPNCSSAFFPRSPSRMRPLLYSTPNLLSPAYSTPSDRATPSTSLKSLLPRLWDALSSPGRNSLSRSGMGGRGGLLSSPGRKGKGKNRDFDYNHAQEYSYEDLPPLDGEEGELIDDEACFIDVRAITGIDILSLLPPEVSLHILSRFLDLSSILACLNVSRTWRELAGDNGVWRELFLREKERGWGVDLRRGAMNGRRASMYEESGRLISAIEGWNRRRLVSQSTRTSRASSTCIGMRRTITSPPEPSSSKRVSTLTPWGPGLSVHLQAPPSTPIQSPSRSHKLALAHAPLLIDWRLLYKERYELDQRWAGGEPDVMRISGHADSVYCLEFDSTRIITGSRDKTIKVWSLRTGKLLGTFRGHGGSVLCLKFDQDWDGAADWDDEGGAWNGRRTRPGFMVSGSSDCSVCVWDMYACQSGEGQVKAEVRTVLKGHSGGVLDLRIDKRWIVSCSKDALIRVWDRSTLTLHRTLRGHEGPVNAVGLQSERVVSASGDGKMILWDIESGERLRIFEGHDRGLACIEFKDDLIVSGSNDCKIKVWSASTGECIQTLVGHDLLVRALSFDPPSGRLVSASYDKSVKVWDLKTGKMVREFRNSHTSHIFDVKFDVGRIVSTSHDQKIVVLNFTRGLDASLFV